MATATRLEAPPLMLTVAPPLPEELEEPEELLPELPPLFPPPELLPELLEVEESPPHADITVAVIRAAAIAAKILFFTIGLTFIKFFNAVQNSLSNNSYYSNNGSLNQ